MSHELTSGQNGEMNTGIREQSRGLPPPVNFRDIALNAISGGIFALDEQTISRNRRIRYKYGKFPTSVLETPYGNGPMVIERGERDVPEEVSYVVRRNIADATRLLLPTNQLMLYFHQKFTNGNVFESQSVDAFVSEYRAPNASLASKETFKDSDISFQTKGVDRRSFDRTLFTREEHIAGLEFVIAHPETVLAVLTYQAVIQDYFQELRAEFENLSAVPNSGVNAAGLVLYDKYTQQWTVSNFTDELIPVMAVLAHQQRAVNSDLSDDQIITQELFQRATAFIIENGAFRNWVTVPADIALDHKERVNHFLCPAVGAVREQLLDGALLSRIYGIIKQRGSNGGNPLQEALEAIRSQANEKYEKRDEKPLTREDIVALREERENITVSFQGSEYRIKVDDAVDGLMRGGRSGGDIILDIRSGNVFYKVMKNAMEQAVAENKPVYFSFNGTGYRITPDKVKTVLK